MFLKFTKSASNFEKLKKELDFAAFGVISKLFSNMILQLTSKKPTL